MACAEREQSHNKSTLPPLACTMVFTRVHACRKPRMQSRAWPLQNNYQAHCAYVTPHRRHVTPPMYVMMVWFNHTYGLFTTIIPWHCAITYTGY